MKTKKTATKKTAPDLMTVMQKGTGAQAKVPAKEVPTRTAEQIAADFETQGKKYLQIADILRGKK